MLKRSIKIICILTIILTINYPKLEEKYYSIKINKIIKQKEKIPDYININNYNLLIKSGKEKEVLKNNYVYLMNNSTNDNIFLAGHNSKLVFNRIYDLKLNDEVILYLNNKKYYYEVINMKYINVDDNSIFKKENYSKLTLITCTYTNQKRYIVVLKKYIT